MSALIRVAGAYSIMPSVLVKPSPEALRHIRLLSEQIAGSLSAFIDCEYSVRLDEGLIVVDTSDAVETAGVVSRFPGVAYAAMVERVGVSFDEVLGAIVDAGRRGIYPNERFGVSVEASYSPPPSYSKDLASVAISHLIGEVIDRGARPDDKNPEKIIHAVITKDSAYIFTHSYRGLGGLPYNLLCDCITLVEPTLRSLVGSWLIQRTGFGARYLVVKHPDHGGRRLYQALEAFSLLRMHVPARTVRLTVVDVSNLRAGEGGSGYTWAEFKASIAVEAAGSEGVGAVSLPLNPGLSIGVLSKHLSRQVWLLTPSAFLTVEELSSYARRIGVRRALPSDAAYDTQILLDASGRAVSDIRSLTRSILDRALRVDVEEGLVDAHKLLDQIL